MNADHVLLGVGGAHVDRIGRIDGVAQHGVSNPGSMGEWVGGCMANMVRVAASLTDRPIGLIGARGADAGGHLVAEAIDAAGINDHSAVFLDRTTPSYTAILDKDGDVVVALADMALYETGLARHLKRAEPRALMAAANTVVVDANLPETAIGTVLDATPAPVAAHVVSPAKAPRLLAHANRLALVFMNRREMNVLIGRDTQAPTDTGALRSLTAIGFDRAVISDGVAPVTMLDNGTVTTQPVMPTDTIVDVTGAGDALAGAVLALWPAMSLVNAVRVGVVAAAKTIGVDGPVAPDLNHDDLAKRAAGLPKPTQMQLPELEPDHANHPV